PPLDVAALSGDAQDLRRKTHETLGRSEDDYGRRRQFNTVVAAVMELANSVSKFDSQITEPTPSDSAAIHEALCVAVLVLSPIAPHITHALWQRLGHTEAVVDAAWPEVDEAALVQQSITLAVQVNGKVRGEIEVPVDLPKADIIASAYKADNVGKHLEGKTVRKEIVVPNKLVNIVVG
ncbi:MAG TPA: leucine--tRNA ligase, partial [Gammaproteobacteria bacterium]|nr:leucine--tRNA ligase [Gammaproteobacteria bacterium]